MNEKGFTLVELLGVLVLLTVVVLVAFPNILGVVKSTSDQVSDATKSLLESNARSYVNDNLSNYSDSTKKNYCVSVEDLIEEGYTKTPIASVSKDSAKEIEESWAVSFQCQNSECSSFVASKKEC